MQSTAEDPPVALLYVPAAQDTQLPGDVPLQPDLYLPAPHAVNKLQLLQVPEEVPEQ